MSATSPTLSPEALVEIYAHATREYPKECCGIVFGAEDGTSATRVKPCRNYQDHLHAEDPVLHPRDASNAYNLEPKEIFLLNKSLRGAEPARVIYHSHPEVGAYFSDTDQAAAAMDGEPTFPVDHLVVDIRKDGAHGAVQFTWEVTARKYVEARRYP